MNHLIWRVPLYILAAICVPIGLVAALGIEALLDRLGMAIGLFVAYEVLLYLALFASTGQGRSKTRAHKVARDVVEFGSSIVHSIPGFFSVRRRRYLRHVRDWCHRLDVPGLSRPGDDALSLHDVFIEPSLTLHPSNWIPADPSLQVPRELRTGRHTIWTYLCSGVLQGRSLVVTGSPGSGKTTLLKHVALTLAAGPLRRFQLKAPSKLPLLLSLRDHAESIARAAWPGDYDLVHAIQAALIAAQCPDLPATWFERLLGRGTFLVLLDGLDEVADPTLRKQVVAWIEDQVLAYPRVRFVLASRPLGYRANPLDQVTHLEILSLSRLQVERLVRKEYLAYESARSQKRDSRVATAVEAGVRDLLGQLWSRYSLAELAANPLFLTMFAALHRRRRSLPEYRFELCAEMCKVLMSKGQAVQGGTDASMPVQERSLLALLAHEMVSRQVLQISRADAEAAIQEQLAHAAPGTLAGEYLRDLEQGNGLLIERASGVYAFAHRTFQEYWAGVHAQERHLEPDLAGSVGDPWWHETIRFCAAQYDASTIVSHCLAHDPPSIPELVLAIECVTEAHDVFPDVRVRFDEMMQRGAEDGDPERCRIVAQAFLARRLRSLVPLDDDRWADTTLIAHAEYQLFLDEKRVQDQFCRPDHWTKHTFPQGTAQAPVLGVRYADALAFCEWLTAREGGMWRYRVPAATELDAGTVPEGSGYWSLDGAEGRCVGTEAPGWDAAGRIAEQWTEDAIAVNLARACARAIDLASVIGRASALDLDLASDLARARDRAIDLAGAINLARDLFRTSERASVRVRDLAVDLASARAIARARDLKRGLARIIASASAGTCAIARDIARANDLVRAQALAGAVAGAVDLVGDDDLADVIDLTRACDLARTVNFAGAVNLSSARTVDRNLAHTVAVNLARTIDHGSLSTSAYQTARNVIGLRAPLVGLGLESVDSLLTYVRRYTVLSLWLIETSLIRAPSWWARHVRSGSELDRWEKLEQLQHRLTDLYIDLCIWDARVKGEFPPFEGIRIVRERIAPGKAFTSRPS